jgi:hypothetical protein
LLAAEPLERTGQGEPAARPGAAEREVRAKTRGHEDDDDHGRDERIAARV